MVATGLADFSLQLHRGRPWAYAAFAATVRGAGGAFSYLDGSSRLRSGRPALFSNRRVHDGALDLLGALEARCAPEVES